MTPDRTAPLRLGLTAEPGAAEDLVREELLEDDDAISADPTGRDAGRRIVDTVRGMRRLATSMVLTGRGEGTQVGAIAASAQGAPIEGGHDGPGLAAALDLEVEARERLDALETAKNEFVTTASHELRTPLSAITASAEMLQDEAGLTARQTGFVAAIVRNAARLTALADDLLLLSDLSSPRLRTETLTVDLRTVVSSAEVAVAALAAEKRLDVRWELPALPALVTGNPAQLRRVVLNLMSNAVKFSENEAVVVCRVSSTPEEVLMAVIDTGVGIPEDEQEQLFTRFFRSSAARERAIQGSGLGLHVAASIVSTHRGGISFESAAGRGTTVMVCLPRLVDPVGDPYRPEPQETVAGRFVALLGLPGADQEVRDIGRMLDAALASAQQTDQWELLADALCFARGRLEVRGLSDVGLGGIGAALVEAAGPGLVTADRARLLDLLALAQEPLAGPRDAVDLAPLPAAYVEHLLRGDRVGAVALTRRCVTDGMDASAILLDVLEPAQREVGRRWAAGLISVVQEHFCTAVTQFAMTDLYPETFDAEDCSRRLVAVHALGSRHFLGLRMVTDVLECHGWGTSYVGDDIAVETLIALLADERADLLLVSVSMPDQIPAVSAMIRAVRHDPRTRAVKVVVGGRPFLVARDLVDAVGADAWAPDARAAVELCAELVGGRSGQ